MGVTCIAVLHLAVAVSCVVGGIGGLYVSEWGAKGHDYTRSGGQVSDMIAGVGALIALVFFVAALINVLIARGLWKMKNSSRTAAITLSILWIVFLPFGLAFFVSAPGNNDSVLSWLVVWVCLQGWTVWYLSRRNVTAAFESGDRSV